MTFFIMLTQVKQTIHVLEIAHAMLSDFPLPRTGFHVPCPIRASSTEGAPSPSVATFLLQSQRALPRKSAIPTASSVWPRGNRPLATLGKQNVPRCAEFCTHSSCASASERPLQRQSLSNSANLRVVKARSWSVMPVYVSRWLSESVNAERES